MSERGIEIHNGEVIIPAMESAFSVGTRDSPITQSDATLQQVIGAFINTSALGIGWDIHGVWGWVNCAVDRDGDIVGVEGRAYVNDGIQIGGHVYGLHSRIYALGAAILDKNFEALHLAMNVEAGATLSGDATVIRIMNMMRVNPAGAYYIMRLDENGGQTIDAFINTNIAAGSDIDNFLYTAQINTAWGHTLEAGTAAGWIKVAIAGQVRWIQLYSVAPS